MRRAKSAATIRQEAAKVLDRFGISAAPVPIEKIAEALGARLRYSPFEGELAGMLIRDNERTVIGVNSLHHKNRQRFTIAHECGHLLLHKGKDVHIDRAFRVNHRNKTSSQATDPEEIEANRFAAELLMPYQMFISDIIEYEIDVEDEEQLKNLANRYQVSLQAVTHRVTNLLDNVF